MRTHLLAVCGLATLAAALLCGCKSDTGSEPAGTRQAATTERTTAAVPATGAAPEDEVLSAPSGGGTSADESPAAESDGTPAEPAAEPTASTGAATGAAPSQPGTTGTGTPTPGNPTAPSRTGATTGHPSTTRGSDARPASEPKDDGLVIDGTVEVTSNVPEPGSAPYRECLTYVKYKVNKVVSGDYGEGEVLVVLWGMRDNKLLPAAKYRKGDKHELKLVPFDDRPELANVQMADDTDEYSLMPYFAVSAEGI